MIVYIYGLTDPRNNQIRYVGYTKHSVEKRLAEHTKDKRKRPVGDWIQSLGKVGIKPSYTIIEESNESACKEREVHWIAYYRSIGVDLLNATDGGDGVVSPSIEARAKLSAYRKANPNSPETAAKIGEANRKRAAEKRRLLGLPPKKLSLKIKGIDARFGNTKNRGRKHTPEAIAKMSLAKKGKPNLKLRGRKLSPEQIEQIRRVRLGYKHTEESKRKMSESRRGEKNHFFGKHHAVETREKLSIAHMGKKWTIPMPLETREKIAATKRGKPRSAETRAKISATRIERYGKNANSISNA